MASWLGTLAASGPWTVNQWSNSQETRRLARQVLRLTRVQTGDLSSADVGDDTA